MLSTKTRSSSLATALYEGLAVPTTRRLSYYFVPGPSQKSITC